MSENLEIDKQKKVLYNNNYYLLNIITFRKIRRYILRRSKL